MNATTQSSLSRGPRLRGRRWLVLLPLTALLLSACAGRTDSGDDPGFGTSPAPTTASASRTPETVAPDRAWAPGKREYGIQVYAHTSGGDEADASLEPILDYVIARGANSIGITFPIMVDGATPTAVLAHRETPSTAVLAHMVKDAKERGLRVVVRPLIDEDNLVGADTWRGSIKPPNPKEFVAAYVEFLKPYLSAAGQAGADEFVLTTELQSLNPQFALWNNAVTTSRADFSGTFGQVFDAGAVEPRMITAGMSGGVDAYYELALPSSATVGQLQSALKESLAADVPAQQRPRFVVSEVGIAAEDGAYEHPATWGGTDLSRLNPSIQVNWFTAMCGAVRDLGLAGIYFWVLDSEVDPEQAWQFHLGTSSFIERPGEQAITDCFASLAGS